jgi:hypothetical protein
VDVKWSGGLLVWICIAVIVVRVKVSKEICAVPQWGSAVRTLVAWTYQFYFQITQPGSSTVTPLNQEIPLNKTRFD